jgi:hypothetical protein
MGWMPSTASLPASDHAGQVPWDGACRIYRGAVARLTGALDYAADPFSR